MTHGVVTPNMVAATIGRSSAGGIACSTIPLTAPAALARIRRESRLSPATSTTEYIIVMSFTST